MTDYSVDYRNRELELDANRICKVSLIHGGWNFEERVKKPKHVLANGELSGTAVQTWNHLQGGGVGVAAALDVTVEGERFVVGTSSAIIHFLNIPGVGPVKVRCQANILDSDTPTTVATRLKQIQQHAHTPVAILYVKTITVADNGLTDETDTLTVGPTVYNFEAGAPGANEIQIGATDDDTAANIAAQLTTDAATVGIATAVADANVVTITGLSTGANFTLSTNAPAKLTLATTTTGYAAIAMPTGGIIVPTDTPKQVSLTQIFTAMKAAYGASATAAFTSNGAVVTITYGTTGVGGNAQRIATACRPSLPSPLPEINDDGLVNHFACEGLGILGGLDLGGGESTQEIKPSSQRGSIKLAADAAPDLKLTVYQVKNLELLESTLLGAEVAYDGNTAYLMPGVSGVGLKFGIVATLESDVGGYFDSYFIGNGVFTTVSKFSGEKTQIKSAELTFTPDADLGGIIISRRVRPVAIS